MLEEIKKEFDLADEVKKDIENRITKGVATYGERLKPFNGRIALQDAYEEILDLALYIKQEMIEREQKLTEAITQAKIEENEYWKRKIFHPDIIMPGISIMDFAIRINELKGYK